MVDMTPYAATGFPWDGFVGLPSGRPADLLRRSARVNRWLNTVSGTAFTGLVVRLVVASPEVAVRLVDPSPRRPVAPAPRRPGETSVN
ncbi:hypothetical protein [Streptomyces sp. E2N166]|uniref:hypothetical protein n=1 Tax=Streptomyces sp. E2N166 TaxID=1851909 RepID=UPI001EE7A85E|nr:hypothetical protein [Streptomyces sp. E2N166]